MPKGLAENVSVWLRLTIERHGRLEWRKDTVQVHFVTTRAVAVDARYLRKHRRCGSSAFISRRRATKVKPKCDFHTGAPVRDDGSSVSAPAAHKREMNFNRPAINDELRDAVLRVRASRWEQPHAAERADRFPPVLNLRSRGFLNLKHRAVPGSAEALLSVSVSIEEISSLDASLGYIAMQDYLCGRVIACAASDGVRSILEERTSGSPDKLWTLAQPDATGHYRLVAPDSGPLSVLVLHNNTAVALAETTLSLVELDSGSDQLPQPLCGLDGLCQRTLSPDILAKAGAILTWSDQTPGLREELEQLEDDRNILLCSIAVGVLRAALDYVLEYTRTRKAFGKSISLHQAVMLRLADVFLALESTQLMLADAAITRDRRAEQIEAACEYGRENLWNAILQASQLLGGHGYLEFHPVERWIRDIECVRSLMRIRGESS
jgi:hypothetical protein